MEIGFPLAIVQSANSMGRKSLNQKKKIYLGYKWLINLPLEVGETQEMLPFFPKEKRNNGTLRLYTDCNKTYGLKILEGAIEKKVCKLYPKCCLEIYDF